MSTVAVGRRVKRPKDMAELEKFLVGRREGRGGRDPVFGRLIDLLAFAAVYAAAHGQYQELIGVTGEPIPEHLFEDSYAGVFYALHMLHEPGPQALADETAERRVTIFEGFANAGMQMLAAQVSLLGDPGDEIERLLRDCVPQMSMATQLKVDASSLVQGFDDEFGGEADDSL